MYAVCCKHIAAFCTHHYPCPHTLNHMFWQHLASLVLAQSNQELRLVACSNYQTREAAKWAKFGLSCRWHRFALFGPRSQDRTWRLSKAICFPQRLATQALYQCISIWGTTTFSGMPPAVLEDRAATSLWWLRFQPDRAYGAWKLFWPVLACFGLFWHVWWVSCRKLVWHCHRHAPSLLLSVSYWATRWRLQGMAGTCSWCTLWPHGDVHSCSFIFAYQKIQKRDRMLVQAWRKDAQSISLCDLACTLRRNFRHAQTLCMTECNLLRRNWTLRKGNRSKTRRPTQPPGFVLAVPS